MAVTAASVAATAALPGEVSRRPDAVLVHNPARVGALSVLASEPDPDVLRDRYLFRAHPNAAQFALQHHAFVAALRRTGVKVHEVADLLSGDPALEPAGGNPNQVYTRDALVTLPWSSRHYIAGRMHSPIRRSERVTMQAALGRLGLTAVVDVPDQLVLEGGDVIPFVREGRRTLLIGYGRRTQRETLDFLLDTVVPAYADEIIGIRLAQWRINLDGGMVPVSESVAITHPDSLLDGVLLDRSGASRIDVLEMFRDLGMTVVEVTREESTFQQACNCLCLGDGRIVCYDLCPRLIPILVSHGVEPICVPGSELVKGTGGPRCMSRPIYMR